MLIIMHNRLRRMLLLLLALPLLFAAVNAQTAPAPLVIKALGDATAKLDGTWQFHLGDNPGWAAPAVDDSAWEGISAARPWGEQGHEGYTGIAWYRRHIDFTTVPGAAPDLAIFFPAVADAYEVYWNGYLVGTDGRLPPDPFWFYLPPPHTFGLGQERKGVLAIRVWKAPYQSFDPGTIGGFSGVPLAGSPAAIAAHKASLDYNWLKVRQYNFVLNVLYALVAVLGFLAWVRKRDYPVLLWVSLYALAHVLVVILTGLRVPFSNNVAIGWLQPVLTLQDISLWFLLLYLLQLDRNTRLRRWAIVLAIISTAATCLDGGLVLFDWTGSHVHALQILDAVLTGVFTMTEVFPLVLIPFAFGKRLDPARWFVAICASLTEMIVVARIAATQGQRFTHWTLADKISAPLFRINGNSFSLVTITATLLFVAIIYAIYRYSVEEGERQAAIEQEFKSAQELQRVLIPETLPSISGFTVTSAYVPAQEVGGDFFQVIPRADGSALFVVGDVSGKGLKAAMTVSLIVGALRTFAEIYSEPGDILSGLNRRLSGRLGNGFVTCIILRLNSDGSCVLATAGHPAPFLNDFELSLPDALPLGLVREGGYEQANVQLEIGDRLTLYTDGLLEARSATGDIYSFDRLRDLIATRPDARTASDAAVAFGQDDDITVLTITRLEIGAESTTSLVAPKLHSAPA